MKKYCVSLIFLLFAGISFGQTVDDVIGKYVDAMGGAEKLKSINWVRDLDLIAPHVKHPRWLKV